MLKRVDKISKSLVYRERFDDLESVGCLPKSVWKINGNICIRNKKNWERVSWWCDKNIKKLHCSEQALKRWYLRSKSGYYQFRKKIRNININYSWLKGTYWKKFIRNKES